MKKFMLTLIASSMSIVSVQGFCQADVDIVWEKPETFRDVKPTSQSRKSFREQTFNSLQEYMQKLAERLPDGQTLTMTVTNLDLAGQVWPASFVGLGMSGSDVRVVKSIDIPRMTFSYQLKDKQGVEIQQADVDLKDMAFMDRANRMFSSENLRYEKNMLKNWFEDEFPQLTAKN